LSTYSSLLKKYDTIIICRTPLQSLIANLIASLKSEETFLFVYIAQSYNCKNKVYYDQLNYDKLFFEWHTFTRSHTINELITTFRVVYSLRKISVRNIIAASIGTFELSVLAALKQSPQLFTYDDGTFNLMKDVSLDWVENEPRIRRLLKKALNSMSIIEIVRKSKLHYTIFDPRMSTIPFGEYKRLELTNLIDRRACVIPDFRSVEPVLPSGRKKVRVLLGTFFFDERDQSSYSLIRSKFPYDFYLPHPEFDDSDLIGIRDGDHNKAIAPSNLIAEDYVLHLRACGYSVVLYGFCSTALLTCSKIARSVCLMIGASHERSFKEIALNCGVRCLNGFGSQRSYLEKR